MTVRIEPQPLAAVVEAFPHLRQSLLADWDACRLMTRWRLEGYPYDNAAQARGIIFHRFAAEALRTLRRTGETRIPSEDALAILYDVAAQRDVPPNEVVTVPAPERRLLRMAALRFAAGEYSMDRLIDVERRLFATVRYPESIACPGCPRPEGDPRRGIDGTGRNPDGGDCRRCGGSGLMQTGAMIERSITGQPDALIALPPDGAIVLDWKTTLQPPPKYTGTSHDTPAGVSYMGYFQQRVYALLIMRNYQSIQRVQLREFYILSGEARVSEVIRGDLEHVERELAALVEQLDRALTQGSDSEMWTPTPGKHCVYCPRPMACPILDDVRAAEGGIATPGDAERAAAQFVLAKRVTDVLREALKPWVDEHGPVPVKASKGRYEVGWMQRGSRRVFGAHAAQAPMPIPDDERLEAAFAEAAERREAAFAEAAERRETQGA